MAGPSPAFPNVLADPAPDDGSESRKSQKQGHHQPYQEPISTHPHEYTGVLNLARLTTPRVQPRGRFREISTLTFRLAKRQAARPPGHGAGRVACYAELDGRPETVRFNYSECNEVAFIETDNHAD